VRNVDGGSLLFSQLKINHDCPPFKQTNSVVVECKPGLFYLFAG